MLKRIFFVSSVFFFFSMLVFASVNYANGNLVYSVISGKKHLTSPDSTRFGFTNTWVRR